MPQRTPNLLIMLGFCQWYQASNSNPQEFNINSSGIKLISKRLRQKAIELNQEKRVGIPGLPEFLAEADSEASNTESPHFEDVIGDRATQEAPIGQAKPQLRKKKRKRKIPTSTSSKSERILPLLNLERSKW